MREKFTVTLGSMHLVAGVTASLLFAGAAFVGGMKVEKARTKDVQAGIIAPDPLATLDAREQKFAEARDDAEILTFQDELTRQRPMELLAPPPPTPVLAVAQPAAASAPAQTVPAKATRPAEPPRVPAKAAPSAAVAAAKPAGAAPRAVSGESALREALARGASRPDRAHEGGGSFTLQISASQSRDEAERFSSQLRERGYAPYIVEAHVPGKGTFYRVRMGRFGSKDAAQRYLADLRRESQVEAFVTPAQ